jgi:hypothetical protein
MARTITQIESVFIPPWLDGIGVVADDGSVWVGTNDWANAITWTKLSALPGARAVKSISAMASGVTATIYALATDGTIWGMKQLSGTWIQGANIPQT